MIRTFKKKVFINYNLSEDGKDFQFGIPYNTKSGAQESGKFYDHSGVPATITFEYETETPKVTLSKVDLLAVLAEKGVSAKEAMDTAKLIFGE